MRIILSEITQKFRTTYIALSSEEYTFAVINIKKNPHNVPSLIKEAITEYMNEYDMDEMRFNSKFDVINVYTDKIVREFLVHKVYLYE